ncbi:DUF2933 domain-containing protein [Streptomyces sp. NPDC006385]|uniref:DUF2933 domain-containing protein n=1 Tax=unclassified Streptomyces TaxID=2593676 RepID=UPI00339F57D5
MTNKRHYGLYALALAIAFVGALALGVPSGTLAILTLIAACPLMMFFMMRGNQDGHSDNRNTDKTDPIHKGDQHPRRSPHRRP